MTVTTLERELEGAAVGVGEKAIEVVAGNELLELNVLVVMNDGVFVEFIVALPKTKKLSAMLKNVTALDVSLKAKLPSTIALRNTGTRLLETFMSTTILPE